MKAIECRLLHPIGIMKVTNHKQPSKKEKFKFGDQRYVCNSGELSLLWNQYSILNSLFFFSTANCDRAHTHSQ
jgi:hypothetical protein